MHICLLYILRLKIGLFTIALSHIYGYISQYDFMSHKCKVMLLWDIKSQIYDYISQLQS